MVKTLLQVQSLVGGLRSHMPHGQKTKHKLETNSVQILKMIHIQKKKKTQKLEVLHLCLFFFKILSYQFKILSYQTDAMLGGPGGSVGKQSACNTGDLGSIPGLGRSPGEGNDNPLDYSGLENSTDRGAWRAIVLGVAKIRHD